MCFSNSTIIFVNCLPIAPLLTSLVTSQAPASLPDLCVVGIPHCVSYITLVVSILITCQLPVESLGSHYPQPTLYQEHHNGVYIWQLATVQYPTTYQIHEAIIEYQECPGLSHFSDNLIDSLIFSIDNLCALYLSLGPVGQLPLSGRLNGPPADNHTRDKITPGPTSTCTSDTCQYMSFVTIVMGYKCNRWSL